jgi:uncharacterized protein
MARPTGSIEKRTSFVSELRSDDSDFSLEGYAAEFDSLSSDLGGFRERIARGAFARSLASKDTDVKCLAQHDPNQILGRQKNGTLTCVEDARGLAFRCKLNPASQMHKDIYASVQRGDIDSCSFAFTVKPEDETWDDADDDGVRFTRRTLRSVNLLDCSVVTYPAYPQGTDVSARSLPQYGAAEFFRYAAARAKALGKEISFDKMHLTTMRQYELIDSLNRADAARIGKQIESELYTLESSEREQERAAEELRLMRLRYRNF